ncbi:hypothetical protein V1517DRAFT_349272 [Lipomyces orientalis]|uniref:Uncharacterized protein n=1 Tax=Lipomyces orientalis TaxID=1233043 RepID=A0ACC3TED8_9ASCO
MPSETPQLNAVAGSEISEPSQSAPLSQSTMPGPPVSKSVTMGRRQLSCEYSKDPYSKLLQYYEAYLPPRRKQGRWVDSPDGEKTVWVPDRFSMASTSSMMSTSDDLELSLSDAASDYQRSVCVCEQFTGARPINIRVIPPTPGPSIRNSNAFRRNRSTRSTRSIRTNRRGTVADESTTLSPINADYIQLSRHIANCEALEHPQSSSLSRPTTPLKQRSLSRAGGEINNDSAAVLQNLTPDNRPNDPQSAVSYRIDQQLFSNHHEHACHPANSSRRNENSIWAYTLNTTVNDIGTTQWKSYETTPADDVVVHKEHRGDRHIRQEELHSSDSETVVSDLDEDFGYDAYHSTLRYTTESGTVKDYDQTQASERLPASLNIGINNRHSIGPDCRRDRIIRESGHNSPLDAHPSARKERKFSVSTVLSTVNSIKSSSASSPSLSSRKLSWKNIWGNK